MASTRTARVIAVAAALPFAAALFTGVAQADNGGLANNGSSSAATSQTGTGVAGSNLGNSTTGQQVANGAGASNQNNTASVNGSGPTRIDQTNATVNFTNLW
ncbi:hypothetical protein WKI65_15525 [Streptomyces sp. MS1.AVA.3]|uniref:hypothetical protein n=1 Tax=Streptomyces decoyicus TaxID=249567 RepID=UPI00069CF0ED|nr:hypothetical protein [Streptomyces decoyicus]KOG49169.1 hypothetical protein ADK74_06085 [Streptomyces decoyicus]QZY17207.1 hypothetical protein K7C20_19700 [Streptomyces decoyicus]